MIRQISSMSKLDNGIIRITVDACKDQLGQAILEIRRRSLIAPLFEHAQGMVYDLEQHIPQFASAFFACACLTTDFTRGWG